MTNALRKPTAEEANRAGRECVDCSMSLQRDIARLESTPATLADIIQKRIRGIGLRHHEQVVARARALLRDDPAAAYFEHTLKLPLASAVEHLEGVIEIARHYEHKETA